MSVFDGVPPYNGVDTGDWILRARLCINGLLSGKSNNTGNFTLATSTASTVVVLAKGRLGPDTVVVYMPTTANAATELALGTMFVSSRNVASNTFTLTNSNNHQNDRTFAFILVG